MPTSNATIHDVAIALIAAVPATVAAASAWKVNKKVKTNNGKDIGQYVELNHRKLDFLNDKLDTHIQDTRIHFCKEEDNE